MIKKENLDKLVIKYQTSPVNIYREYCQNIFLSFLYRENIAENILFKGGTALRLVYGSPRYSEDLDFSLFKIITSQLEEVLLNVVSNLDKNNLSPEIIESKETTGGYLANLELRVHSEKIKISIQGSRRNGRKIKPNIQLIVNDFVPSYIISLLPEKLLMQEKLSAALTRSKPRDFFDIYFLLKKNLIPIELRPKLDRIPEKLRQKNISFKKELSDFLPKSMHGLINNFDEVLVNELGKFV